MGGCSLSMTLSAVRMIRCGPLLSMTVVAVYQMVMEEVRMDLMMAVYKCTVIVIGRWNLFSCRRKYIL